MKIDFIKENYSPCDNCLVKPCCTQFCDAFITFYMCIKTLVELKLEKNNIDTTTRKGNEIYTDIMMDILKKVKTEHRNTIQSMEQVLYNFNIK